MWEDETNPGKYYSLLCNAIFSEQDPKRGKTRGIWGNKIDVATIASGSIDDIKNSGDQKGEDQ